MATTSSSVPLAHQWTYNTCTRAARIGEEIIVATAARPDTNQRQIYLHPVLVRPVHRYFDVAAVHTIWYRIAARAPLDWLGLPCVRIDCARWECGGENGGEVGECQEAEGVERGDLHLEDVVGGVADGGIILESRYPFEVRT